MTKSNPEQQHHINEDSHSARIEPANFDYRNVCCVFAIAQFCFFKILHIISSIPPCQNSEDQLGIFSSREIGIDLNLQLDSVEENGESESFSDNKSDSSANEANRCRDQGESRQEKSAEVSELTNDQAQTLHIDDNGDDREETKFEDQKSTGGDNCLDLVIEAAKVISASSAKDDSGFEGLSRDRVVSGQLRTRRTSHRSGILELREPIDKGKQKWMVVGFHDEMDNTSPVVRSKRGRSQALPYRFRDSVVGPLKRSRTSSTTAASRKRLIGS
ncbi:hypothetical protein L6164_022075 [Bauhinia variegata]|uniref:Uncharacterized protein n=1 Tax=Bauhinia variegata TaxID=167791 RepID=A0ACB9MDZ9_BAUVA|nr:hypothetical protein L6164_022075 [Bauhinia variegata]